MKNITLNGTSISILKNFYETLLKNFEKRLTEKVAPSTNFTDLGSEKITVNQIFSQEEKDMLSILAKSLETQIDFEKHTIKDAEVIIQRVKNLIRIAQEEDPQNGDFGKD